MIQTIDHGAIRELRLSRPPVNALSPELIAALLQGVETAPQEGKRALVLSGSPGMFSAGLDVPLLLKLDRPAMDALWREFYALLGETTGPMMPTIQELMVASMFVTCLGWDEPNSIYSSLPSSVLACRRIGMSGSASCQMLRNR